MSGVLYIVATPIGNLEDMTFRAVRILGEADLIAAEDTRHSLKLLNHFNISRPLTSYFDHNQQLKGERIIQALQEGKNVALVSDAGTPCISDPGYQLVKAALACGVRVIPIPGACAAVAALSAAGLPSDMFTFAGFAPSRQGKRRSFLSGISSLPGTVILYEAPHRIGATLADIRETMGERRIVLAREITKIYEQFLSGTVSEVLEQLVQGCAKGEMVIMIEPGDTVVADIEPVESLLKRFVIDEKLPAKDAARKISEISNISKTEAYRLVLETRNSGG
ncbi:MAG TPA: 16S rRNA (cytidine(1402)-2'-O)-methyltransferase [Deltaproteobacteria bacterium]|nr:16S rRNA (cytidine(1402)-2'-O)-methyltransferase [Deltaproteobacteria bacterium]HQB38471.1 16S rRNA (cytidine(1402)-2'-O)-methyltransferase [Deltaproteobacteria bacterium]